jgi:hypothetical protein
MKIYLYFLKFKIDEIVSSIAMHTALTVSFSLYNVYIMVCLIFYYYFIIFKIFFLVLHPPNYPIK